VSCTFTNGTTGTVDVTWSVGSYSQTAAFYDDIGYNITGTPVEIASIKNPGNVTTTASVTVKDAFFPVTNTLGPIYSWKDMVTNTDNAFGIVNSSSGITTIKSVAPGPTGINLVSFGTAPVLSGGRGVLIGTGAWIQSPATTDFDFLFYNATAADLKWTAIVAGNFTDTNAVTVGVFGHNGFSAGNTGVAARLKQDSTSTQSSILITENGVDAIRANFTTMMTYGSDMIASWQLDNSLAAASGKVKGFNGTTQHNVTATGTFNLDNVPAADPFEIGDLGSTGTVDMSGNLAMIVFIKGTETDSVRNKLVQDIAAYVGITL
jgi:hypothetical protein